MSTARLIDVGSTVIKMCTTTATGLGQVVRVPRDHGSVPGLQVLDLLARGPDLPVHVCSSANGGLRVGVVGLTRRHSLRAATTAIADGGGNIVYARLLGEHGPSTPPVDALVVVGGVDGADLSPLRDAVRRFHPDVYPRRVLVWAGAEDAEAMELLAPDVQVPNVIDCDLRPTSTELADVVRELYVSDLVDRKGLAALTDVVSSPIRPTPSVVGMAADGLVSDAVVRAVAPDLADPLVVIDVGGATTDVFISPELRLATIGRVGHGGRVVRRVFTDLGVVVSREHLLRRARHDPTAFDLSAVLQPQAPRELFSAMITGEPGALAGRRALFACVFLALRAVADATGPAAVDLERARGFLVTGGAVLHGVTGDSDPARGLSEVVTAACRRTYPASVAVDTDYLLWAHGLRMCS